jgi:hypothetical protein
VGLGELKVKQCQWVGRGHYFISKLKYGGVIKFGQGNVHNLLGGGGVPPFMTSPHNMLSCGMSSGLVTGEEEYFLHGLCSLSGVLETGASSLEYS